MRAVIRGTRRLLFCLGFLVLLMAALVTGMLWLTLPPRSQQARIPGLSGPVDIGFDADGIPRIRAANELMPPPPSASSTPAIGCSRWT